MTQGAPDSLCEARSGFLTMTSDKERGEKRGVLATERVRDEDADADAANDTNED